MLITCKECELPVSDKALNCPHCGYPMRSQSIKKRQTKRRRLPNGFGQITEIKNKKLRKPFRAMKTVGKDSNGRPIVKPLKPESYFETYNEAYAALMEYNKNPYDLDNDMTVKELYDKWSKQYFESLTSSSSHRTIESAWKYCSAVYDMRVKDLRARHIKGCIEDGVVKEQMKEKHTSPTTKTRIKSLFNLMLDYALEYELVDRNYARTFKLSKGVIEEQEEAKRCHIPFTADEMDKLWQNIDKIKYVDLILIQCYSGWRPQELGLIEKDVVNLDGWYFRGGMKTDAGKDRFVPIHPRIRPLVKKYYDEASDLNSKYLFNCTDSRSLKMTYDKYSYRFEKIVQELGLNPEHKPHDPRMHFTTMAKRHEVDQYAIKYIIGHSINDLTEKVYTKRDESWLIEEIQKID